MSFDFDRINNTIGKSAADMDKQVRDFSKTMDPNSTADMVKLQSMMQKWTIMNNLQSSMIKTLADSIKGVIQKF